MTVGNRGITLLELVVAVAIAGLLSAVGASTLSSIAQAGRSASAKFAVVQSFELARQRAAMTGRDVYLVLADLDALPGSSGPRVLVYDDRGAVLRTTAGALDAILATVNASPTNVYSQTRVTEEKGLSFVSHDGTAAPSCSAAGTLPSYVAVRGDRATHRECGLAFCTFCEVQAGSCIGAIRFSGDGSARAVTGPDTGSGGLLTMPASGDGKATCVAFGEPDGRAVAY